LNFKLPGLQFIKDDLQKQLEPPFRKRTRKFGTMSHFLILGAHLWGHDWHKYGSPKDRLDLWDGIMLNAFTSARVGEYIESTVREGSGRGLHYKVSLLRRPCLMYFVTDFKVNRT